MRRVALLLLLFAAAAVVLASAAASTGSERESRDNRGSTTAERAASSRTDSASTPRRQRKLLCDVSTVTNALDASLGFGGNSSGSYLTPYVKAGGGRPASRNATDPSSADAAARFRSLDASASNRSGGGAINDMCSQAPPVVDSTVSDPLDSREVLHARAWSEEEVVATAMRRRGRTVRVLTEFDLAAASPMLLPNLIRFRPLSDAAYGNEVARVMEVFSDGTVPAKGPGSDPNGLPSVVRDLEVAAAESLTGRGGERQTISAEGIRRMLSRPELVLIAMASNRTGADRVTKEEYRDFLVRDSRVDVCEDPVINGNLREPIDLLFSRADRDGDGTLDAFEIKASNLTDAATVWMLAGDRDGDGLLSPDELATGLPQFVDLQPRGGMQNVTERQLERIRQVNALAAVGAYDLAVDAGTAAEGKLTLGELRTYSDDFTRRSMGQTMVPIWAFAWHVATVSVGDRLEAEDRATTAAASKLKEWKGIQDAEDRAAAKSNGSSLAPAPAPPAVKLLNLTDPIHHDFFFNASDEDHRFEDSAALRAFMIGHARYSMSARAALAAAAATNKSFGSAEKNADLAAGFDLWSRGPSPTLTQREWIEFYSAIYRTGARAYWTIARRAGSDAAAPECCAVLAPGLVEIAKALPPQLGQAPISMPLERAIADAVRFDADGDGVQASELAAAGEGTAGTGKGNESLAIGTNAAALTHVDILEYGVMRLGTLCNALPPVEALGH